MKRGLQYQKMASFAMTFFKFWVPKTKISTNTNTSFHIPLLHDSKKERCLYGWLH